MNADFTRSNQFESTSNRDLNGRLQPLSAVVLAVGLILAVLSEGQIPELWTKGLLGLMIVPPFVTAMWLTGPKGSSRAGGDLDPRQA